MGEAFKARRTSPELSRWGAARPRPPAARLGSALRSSGADLQAEARSEGRGSTALCPPQRGRGEANAPSRQEIMTDRAPSLAPAPPRPPGPQAAPEPQPRAEGPGRAPSSPPPSPRATQRRQAHRVGAGGRRRGGCTTARARPAAGCSGPWLGRAPCRPRAPREAAAARERPRLRGPPAPAAAARAGRPRRPGPPEPAPQGAAAEGAPRRPNPRQGNAPRQRRLRPGRPLPRLRPSMPPPGSSLAPPPALPTPDFSQAPPPPRLLPPPLSPLHSSSCFFPPPSPASGFLQLGFSSWFLPRGSSSSFFSSLSQPPPPPPALSRPRPWRDRLPTPGDHFPAWAWLNQAGRPTALRPLEQKPTPGPPLQY